jgi:hypothetical protein
MKFALAKAAVTPQRPVFLAGYGSRDHPSEGVLDDLYMRAVVLRERQTLCILTIDALGGDRSFVRGIKAALRERIGLREEHVLINFSHTHSSVYLTGEDAEGRRGNYSIVQQDWPERDEDLDYAEDIRYFHFLAETAVRLAADCLTRLEDGEIRICRGSTAIGISRRLMTEDGMRFRPNPDAEIDRELFVIQLVGAQGGIKGILFGCACHPVCMDQYFISAEFPGWACRLLEERYPEAQAVFLQGCTADIMPVRTADVDRFRTTTPEEMRRIGGILADEVIALLERGGFTPIGGRIEAELLDVRLYTESPDYETIAAIAQNEANSAYKRRAARRVLASIREGREKRSLGQYIAIWRFGERWRLIALEGEIPSAYALMLRALFPQHNVIALGYSNGVSTYIPTRRILREGGYEAEAYLFHTYRGPLVPETEEIILGAIARSELLERC